MARSAHPLGDGRLGRCAALELNATLIPNAVAILVRGMRLLPRAVPRVPDAVLGGRTRDRIGVDLRSAAGPPFDCSGVIRLLARGSPQLQIQREWWDTICRTLFVDEAQHSRLCGNLRQQC